METALSRRCRSVRRSASPPLAGWNACASAKATKKRPERSAKARAQLRPGLLVMTGDQRFLAGPFFAVVFFAGAFLAADFFAGALAALAVVFLAGAFFAADFFAADLAGAFFAGAFLAADFFAGALAALAVVFFAAVFLVGPAALFFAALLDAAFLAPRVAPPRPRSSTPASFRTPCTNPKERPASSAIFRMLSPAEYRLAYREASSVRCVPVMREPLANALATAPPFVLRSSPVERRRCQSSVSDH